MHADKSLKGHLAPVPWRDLPLDSYLGHRCKHSNGSGSNLSRSQIQCEGLQWGGVRQCSKGLCPCCADVVIHQIEVQVTQHLTLLTLTPTLERFFIKHIESTVSN